jgi:hypothetical protein
MMAQPFVENLTNHQATEIAEPKVFVSHSCKDIASAERPVKDLRAAEADTWRDKEKLGACGLLLQAARPLSRYRTPG